MILRFFYLSLRLCASDCGSLLHRILQRFVHWILQRFILGQSTTARSAFEMVIGHLKIILRRHGLRVAKPCTNYVSGISFMQFRLAC